jgi:hypothetical protein
MFINQYVDDLNAAINMHLFIYLFILNIQKPVDNVI